MFSAKSESRKLVVVATYVIDFMFHPGLNQVIELQDDMAQEWLIIPFKAKNRA